MDINIQNKLKFSLQNKLQKKRYVVGIKKIQIIEKDLS